MALGKRASAAAVVKAIMSNADGIGTSKRESRNNSRVVGQNGHNISTKAHSISSIQNLRTVATQYVNFVNENYQGRVLQNISPETIRDFIDYKAESLTDGSLNTYISDLGKLADNLNQLGYDNINRAEIVSYRDELGLERTSENRAYSEPDLIVENMLENSSYGLSAELQLEAGLRVDDALNSSKWEINEDNSLTITGSKGGIEYQTAPLNNDLIERVREAIENEYRGNYKEYRETLKENTAENWHGTHGLRYNFAQNRVSELQEQGLTYNQALAQTSLELGHSREEITLHYLKNS